ncbi:MAG: hypothetical protein D6760_04825 [Deltaproteobacteria bacterium]|nr:MAG: hypothetical protein D6760_04825 [Deltaproteobacteria bacterium]
MRYVCERSAMIALLLAAVSACGGASRGTEPEYTAFGAPERVTVQGYTSDVMEPFVTRDGRYLLFNDAGPTDKNLFVARYDQANDSFVFMGALDAVNTPAVDGVPTVDTAYNIYYVSTFHYPPNGNAVFDTIYRGRFDPGAPGFVTGATIVPDLSEGILGRVNFDVEVSPDGETLYFVDGVFSGGSWPDEADFAYAVDGGSGFVRAPDSDRIFAAINTDRLEYAACISADGLEFFFTRLDPSAGDIGIYRATRTRPDQPFGPPARVSAITGFAEAPALSPDEKTLYYHRKDPSTGRFELWRVRRP